MIAADRVAAILLASGRSLRFGAADKLGAPLRGQPLVLHTANLLARSGFANRLAVCRRDGVAADLLGPAGFDIVMNDAPARGIGHALSLGIRHTAGLDINAALLCLGDMPFVTTPHLTALLSAFDERERPIVATENAATGVVTPPILLARREFARFVTLDGDRGGKALLQGAATVSASAELLADIDRPDDLPAG